MRMYLQGRCFWIMTLVPVGMLTFFPGVVMGWLYWKSDSLLGPILFHGCANIGYAWLGAG